MSDDFDEMAGMPPCPACSDSAPDFCSKHSPHTYHSKSEMRRHEAQKQDPLEAAAMGYAKAYNPKGYTDAGILAFKAGAAWAYANPKASETVDAYIAKVFPCTPPCNSYGVCDNCCDAKLIRVGSQLAANPPSPQVSVEDEAREYAGGMFDECQSASEAIHNARAKGRYDGFLAGHASGRRGGEAEVAELKAWIESESRTTREWNEQTAMTVSARAECDKLTAERNELLENESKMNGALSAKQEIINGLNEDLAEARATIGKTNAAYLGWVEEKQTVDALKSQLTQAQADVAALVDAASLIDDLPHSYANMVPVLVERACTKVRAALARVKGRS